MKTYPLYVYLRLAKEIQITPKPSARFDHPNHSYTFYSIKSLKAAVAAIRDQLPQPIPRTDKNCDLIDAIVEHYSLIVGEFPLKSYLS